MPYSKVKVYSDGSHRIGIPYEPNPYVRKRRKQPEEVITVTEPAEDVSATPDNDVVAGNEPAQTERENIPTVPKQKQMTRKELFEELYQKSADIRKKRERKAYVQREMLPYFKDSISCRAFVEDNFNRKHRNMICRKTRLWRKINQQTFNYFVTFTFDDKKHTEESFQKALNTCLQHFSSRKDWLYIGAWERAPETGRLHFHGIFYIPEGAMSGKLEEVRDYDTRKKRMQTIQQNTFFAERFGRNEFRPIHHSSELPQMVKYLMKYIEKSGGKLVYSRGLYQYFETDIMDEDIICPYGLEERKFILFDDFGCWIEGEYIGQSSDREVIARLPKVT